MNVWCSIAAYAADPKSPYVRLLKGHILVQVQGHTIQDTHQMGPHMVQLVPRDAPAPKMLMVSSISIMPSHYVRSIVLLVLLAEIARLHVSRHRR